MKDTERIIHDPVHGSIKLTGIFQDILDRHEMQRLRGVKQLGSANLVFPGANHTRFEHCLGTYRLAGRMSEALGLNREEDAAIRATGLLHDICHAPFSHTMEGVMEDSTGMNHMELAEALIGGRVRTYQEEDGDICGGTDSIGEMLQDAGIDPATVCGLISSPQSTDAELSALEPSDGGHFQSKDYLHQMIHGPVDVDQMDYLVRDSHYTGVTAGLIDLERILATAEIRNDRVCIRRSGAPAAEGLMMARSLMYSSVYFHPVIRTIDRMLVKAVEASGLDLSDIYLWDDSDLAHALMRSGGTQSELMRRVRGRRFYKQALILDHQNISPDTAAMLAKYVPYGKRSGLEEAVADAAGIDGSEVCIETSTQSSLRSLSDIGKTDIAILENDGRIDSLSKLSPVAKSLRNRKPFGWALTVACPAQHREAVRKAALELIPSDVGP